jgi:ferrochelatase
MKTGVLLVNLGTPDSTSTSDVRKYLKEFLSDPRVLDVPWLLRQFLLKVVILPTRPKNSAALYKHIWTEEGSPLLTHSVAVKEKLQAALGGNYVVELAMRYQSPSIEKALEVFKKPIYDKIIVFPLFPQYASASTGSVHEKIMKLVSEWQIVPPIEFINSYCNQPDFIDAWIERSKEYKLEDYDHYMFSFHGLPERQMRKADYTGSHCLATGSCCSVLSDKNQFCYKAQCYETARIIAQRLGIDKKDYTVCFQSRLGKDPWVKPYTDDELKRLAKEGKKKILVWAPAFVSDCLETIYEIGTEYDELFTEHGGEKVQLVESLNSHPAWIKAIEKMVIK